MIYDQFTFATPTRLNRWVVSRRRPKCELDLTMQLDCRRRSATVGSRRYRRMCEHTGRVILVTELKTGSRQLSPDGNSSSHLRCRRDSIQQLSRVASSGALGTYVPELPTRGAWGPRKLSRKLSSTSRTARRQEKTVALASTPWPLVTWKKLV